MRKKMTLKEISKRFDVSISTVSKALKDSPEISEKTRKMIQEFAREHNYKPNNIALSLKNQQTKNIGIVLPELQHFFFSSITTGIEQYAAQRGYNVIICLSNETFEKEVINMQMLANGSIDGFIMALSQGTERKGDYHHIREVINRGMPVVMFDRVTKEVECDKVIIDDFEGSYDAVKYLIDQGRKRIAILTMPDYMSSVGLQRTEGYKKALTDAGIEVDENLIVKLEDFYEGFEDIEKLFQENKVDGVFAVTEFFAVSAIKAAQKQGLNCPEDVSVIGFTDGIISRSSNPGLTTVSQHGEEIGERAARLLIDRLEFEGDDEPDYTTEYVHTSIVEREST
ncbi:LacI family DNA-binding transcriptional regulator [Robertkochia sediminum]|uniref:LacI family DNA-binding transcriptional regulator n=1 Tax=Robertkochia sediminum TaxID=2785326 RepID=UPI001931DAB2|nr:LacI family DNA-binding transcriptional regulator [Robertkochia sediminum]MBL7474007.1 LacI family DNA-binding transcriptional regulator [Robertkochia sediminum]